MALTRFYDPMEDYGLVYDYLDLAKHLAEADLTALLGTPFGPHGAYFDPGHQGSYFQTPQEVVGSLARVQRIDLSNIDEDQRESWPQFKKLLEECAKVGIGLCVTFKISTDRHLSSPSSRRTWSRGGRRLRPLPKKDDGGYAGKGPAEIDRCR